MFVLSSHRYFFCVVPFFFLCLFLSSLPSSLTCTLHTHPSSLPPPSLSRWTFGIATTTQLGTTSPSLGTSTPTRSYFVDDPAWSSSSRRGRLNRTTTRPRILPLLRPLQRLPLPLPLLCPLLLPLLPRNRMGRCLRESCGGGRCGSRRSSKRVRVISQLVLTDE